MITLAPPDRKLSRSLLDARGGFAWWYVDAVDERGNGAVLIWSYGLPFLPGYASAVRRGRAERAGDRPSLNVALYRGGREAFYLLEELPVAAARWEDDRWQMGRSTFELTRVGAELCMTATLDVDVPGSDERLEGVLEVRGAARRDETASPETHGPHDWSPVIAPARARARLTVGGHSVLELDGRGYHDRNGSSVPLGALGMSHWVWGRASLPGRELVYYVLFPEAGGAPTVLAMIVHEDGRTEHVAGARARLLGRRIARLGMPTWRHVEITDGDARVCLRVELAELVDDGPFYLRYLTRAQDDRGASGAGIAELCVPARVDLAVHRPLVRMRVRPSGATGSRWLPLFSGPREGRVGRLVRSWVRPRGSAR